MKRRPGKAGKDHPRAKKFIQQPAGLWQGGSGLTEKTEGTWIGVLNLEKGDPDLRSPARDRQEWGKQCNGKHWEFAGIPSLQAHALISQSGIKKKIKKK